jgi:prepilin-type N-terminal cleavage/methylation domain-containing protein
MSYSKTRAFTLIELVIVIALLGILAAVAIPRMALLHGDAKLAVMQNIAGTASSTFGAIFAKAAVSGVQDAPSASVTIGATSVQLRYGYPALLSVTDVLRIEPLSNFVITPLSASSASIAPVGANSSTCRLVYTEATSATNPATIQRFLSNCS